MFAVRSFASANRSNIEQFELCEHQIGFEQWERQTVHFSNRRTRANICSVDPAVGNEPYLYAHFGALLYNDIWIEILLLIQKYARIALIEVRMLSLKEWNHDKSQVYLNDKFADESLKTFYYNMYSTVANLQGRV